MHEGALHPPPTCRTNSKATLRINVSELRSLIPPMVYQKLQRSRHYASNSNSLVLQADESRRQVDNVETCYRKLFDTIVETAQQVVIGETSAEQATRVQNLYVFL